MESCALNQTLDNPQLTNLFNLLKEVYTTVALFPQYEKFSLSKDTRDIAKKLIRNYILSLSVKSRRITLLMRAQENLFDLLIQLRLAYELQYINDIKLNSFVTQINDINKLIKGSMILASKSK